MRKLRTTHGHEQYWKKRKINWDEAYTATVNHPHRKLIIETLQKIRFGSVCEIGCASAPNLLLIKRCFPYVQVGGCDVAEAAIEAAKRNIPDGIFDVRSADNMFFSDNSADVGLSDMVCIYYGPRRIKKVLKEMRRVIRKEVIFVEFHSESWWRRLYLFFGAGYFAYNWRKLLEEAGYDDIQIRKLKEKDWPGGQPQQEFAYLITAKV